jgi:diadenosine tetraphosphate (Ap4A) HIT family hydrolase
MKKDDGCFLCNGFADRGGIIYKDKSYFIISDIAPLFENHILFCTNDHITSFAEFSANQLRSVWLILYKLKNLLKEQLKSEIIMFEHGGFHIGCKRICGTNHAHIHIIPVPIKENIFGKDVDTFIKTISINKIFLSSSLDDFSDLRMSNFCHYLMTVDVDNKIRIFQSVNQFDSQILRKYIYYHYRQREDYSWDNLHSTNQAKKATEYLKSIIVL